MKTLVCFHNHGAHFLDPLLKEGFRHCFVAVLSGDYWVRIDGMGGVPEIEVVAGADYDLATFYRAHGYAVVETEQRATPLKTPFVTANCLGMVKSVLGLRAPFVLTPYRLYRRLLEDNDAAWKIAGITAEAVDSTAAPARSDA